MKVAKFLTSLCLNRFGGVPAPSFCTYIITYRCNARCSMCDSWRMSTHQELAVSKAEEIFRSIGRLDVVRLSGGEPFLYEELEDLARRICRQSNPDVLHITTNGSCPVKVEHLINSLTEPRRLWIAVSLDGLPETHDANRKSGASFAQAWETIERLKKLRHRGVKFSVNYTVISDQSIDDVTEMRARLDGMEVDMHCVLAYSASSMYSADRSGRESSDLLGASSYPLHPAISRDKAVRMIEGEILRLPRHGYLTRVYKGYYYKGLLDRLHGRTGHRRPRCTALRSHIRLLPDGAVPVCQFNTSLVGNLAEGSSCKSLWESECAKRSRGWVDACPGCWAECETFPSALYSGDIYAEVLRTI